MWKKLNEEQPPLGKTVLLCVKVWGVWRYIAVPEWTEYNNELNKGKINIFWLLIESPESK